MDQEPPVIHAGTRERIDRNPEQPRLFFGIYQWATSQKRLVALPVRTFRIGSDHKIIFIIIIIFILIVDLRHLVCWPIRTRPAEINFLAWVGSDPSAWTTVQRIVTGYCIESTLVWVLRTPYRVIHDGSGKSNKQRKRFTLRPSYSTDRRGRSIVRRACVLKSGVEPLGGKRSTTYAHH